LEEGESWVDRKPENLQGFDQDEKVVQVLVYVVGVAKHVVADVEGDFLQALLELFDRLFLVLLALGHY
jgi:hypothetical protein